MEHLSAKRTPSPPNTGTYALGASGVSSFARSSGLYEPLMSVEEILSLFGRLEASRTRVDDVEALGRAGLDGRDVTLE